MKKILLWLLVLTMCILMVASFSLVGCKKKAAPAEEEAVEEAAAEEEAAPAEVVELIFWDLTWGSSDTYIPRSKELVEQFNSENPNIHVTRESISWDAWYETFLTAVEGGAAPDVSSAASSQPMQFADMGETLPLDSILAEWEEEGIIDDFIPGSLEGFNYLGIQAGMPWQTDPRGATYRKDVFEQLGLELPETWDDFLNVCREIKDNTDMEPLLLALGDNLGYHIMLNMMYTNNIGIVDKNLNPTMEDPKTIEVLKFFETLYKEELMSRGSAAYTSTETTKLFAEGKGAILMGGPQIGLLGTELGDKIGILPTLTGPSGDKGALVFSNPIMAYKQTEHPEEAKIFLKWWVENSLVLITEGGATALPSRYSHLEDPYFSNSYYQDWKNEVYPYARSATWPAPFYAQIAAIDGENDLGRALQEIWTGNDDIEGIAKQVNDLVKEKFAE